MALRRGSHRLPSPSGARRPPGYRSYRHHPLTRDLRGVRELLAGRVYAGLRSNWGEQLDFGIPFRSVHAYQFLVTERFRMLAPPYGGASLNSDLQFDFNDQTAAQYDLYNVRYVIAPRGLALPGFLQVVRTTTRYVLYAAPSSGHGEY